MIFHVLVLVFSLSFLTGCSLFKTKAPSQVPLEGEEYHDEETEEGETEQPGEEEESLDEEEEIVYIDEEEEMDEGGHLEEEEEQAPESESEEEGSSDNEEDLGFGDLEEDEELSDTFTENQQEEASGTGSPPAAFPPTSKKPAPKKTWIPLKKIKSTPYFKAGVLVNAVYIVREGDTLQSLSQKIFNSDKSAELTAINPHLKKREVKVGDKVYYSSPQRTDNQNQLLFYYEDIGQAPQEHFAQAGQNIRQVAEELLGHPNSWKEIWATNPELQSKGLLQKSVSIKYWTITPPPVEEAASPPPLEEAPPQELSEEEALSPPLPEEEVTDPSLEEAPAPPDFEEEAQQAPTEDSAEASQKGGLLSLLKRDQMIGLGVAALVTVLIFVALIRRRRKKEYDFAATNMEID